VLRFVIFVVETRTLVALQVKALRARLGEGSASEPLRGRGRDG
jgi:hypothetical protein